SVRVELHGDPANIGNRLVSFFGFTSSAVNPHDDHFGFAVILLERNVFEISFFAFFCGGCASENLKTRTAVVIPHGKLLQKFSPVSWLDLFYPGHNLFLRVIGGTTRRNVRVAHKRLGVYTSRFIPKVRRRRPE